ncbi:MAG TPA: hypothetical protein VG142_00170 [Trebonia sp.]|nr:hypothetical protein [Trebonia sp.]
MNDYTPIGPTPVSAYLAGWSDTSKLGQALPVGYPVPALAENPTGSGVWQGGVTIDGVPYECSYGELQLDDDGARQLPPSTATFTGFGFMPITATAYLTQYGSAPIKLVFYLNENTDTYSVVTSSPVTLRVGDVKVDGTTFNVGSDCRTTGPLTSPDSPVTPDELVISGGETPGDPEPLDTVTEGGAMEGLATIPTFTGCVTPRGENLDPLLDATISGPGNLIKIIQGPLCGSVGTEGGVIPPCVAGTNTAQYVPLWTISHGGPYTSSGSLSFRQNGLFGAFYQITCNSGVAGDIADMEGAPRGATGTFGWSSFGDCAGEKKNGPDGTTWTLTEQAAPSLDLYVEDGDVAYGDVWNISLLLTGTGVSSASKTCTLQLSGWARVTYTDSTSTLTSPATANDYMDPVSNNCPEISTTKSVIPEFSYPLSSGVQVTSP